MSRPEVHLEPTEPQDRPRLYRWLAGWSGRGVYSHLPDYETFAQDNGDFFFNGSRPEMGRYLLIRSGEEDIGCISYTCYHLKLGIAEFDIWLKEESQCSRGCGPEAIRLLLHHVRRTLGIHTVLIRPSRQNRRAISAYEKCGFRRMEGLIDDYMQQEFLERYGPGDEGTEGTENLILHLE